jgi:hypothetical protein
LRYCPRAIAQEHNGLKIKLTQKERINREIASVERDLNQIFKKVVLSEQIPICDETELIGIFIFIDRHLVTTKKPDNHLRPSGFL